MDRDLYFLKCIAQANFLVSKFNVSIDELKERHPHRTDLIQSMTEAHRIAVESAEFIRITRDEIQSYQLHNSDLRIQNLQLIKENYALNEQLKAIKSNLTL